MKIRNTFIIFIVSGFWHGANWTFIAWGFLNALYFLPLLLTHNNRNNLDIVAKGRNIPTIKETIQILGTFSLTVFAWIFFRAENISHAFQYISGIFSQSIIEFPRINNINLFVATLLFIFTFLFIEWLGRENMHAIQNIARKYHPIFRYTFYFILTFLIIVFSSQKQEFIYFQF